MGFSLRGVSVQRAPRGQKAHRRSSGQRWRWGASLHSLWSRGIGDLPPPLFSKITVLPMGLNEDLKALFVFSWGLWKRMVAFPDGLALSPLP